MTKRLVVWTIPDRERTLLGHVTELDSVRRGDHAAGHGQALITDVGPSPGPRAALGSGGARRVLTRLGSRQAEIDTQLLGSPTSLGEVVLHPRRVFINQGFLVNEVTHRP